MKNKKNTYKIIFIALIVLAMFFIPNLKVYATDSIIHDADAFLFNGTKDILNMTSIKSVSDRLFKMFSIIGTVVVLIVGAILGVQFIMSTTEEKAKIKETLLPYVIGAAVIFGAFGIWSLVVKVFQSVF